MVTRNTVCWKRELFGRNNILKEVSNSYSLYTFMLYNFLVFWSRLFDNSLDHHRESTVLSKALKKLQSATNKNTENNF